jgi:hypothetical protein
MSHDPLPSGASPARGILPRGAQLNGIYEIDAFISAGGMGEIYRGHEIHNPDRHIAIKLIREELSNDETTLALFRNEAAALGRLHHEAIVRYLLFSLDPVLTRHYLAMEYVDGQPLSLLLEKGPLSVEETFALMRRLALGLQAAHEQNVIHRDVAPDNVIVPAGGVAAARIIDFGIARSLRLEDSGKSVIGEGEAGKYKYMSPEQIGLFGHDVRAASDIYSLGLVLAQCLRGSPIDMGATLSERVDRRRQVPDLSDVDARLRPLLERMLQPDPADRPKSMAEIAAWPLLRAAPLESQTEATVFAPRKTSGTTVEPPRPLPPAKRDGAGRAQPRRIGIPAGTARVFGWTLAALALFVLVGAGGYAAWPSLSAFFAPRLEEPGKRPEEAAPSVQETPSPTIARALRAIREFQGGDCFLAAPTAVTDRSASIDGYGRGKEPFDALDASFAKEIGFEAQIGVREVTPAQCPALSFAKRFLTTTDDPRLYLAKTKLRRTGEELEGYMATQARHVLLLLVDDNGAAHDVTSQLVGVADQRGFAMRLANSKPSPLLLLALGADEPLPAEAPTKSQSGEDYFSRLGSRFAQLAKPPMLTIGYVKME